MNVLFSLVAMSSSARSLLVSAESRLIVIDSPSGLTVLPPVSLTVMASSDELLSIDTAVGCKESESTISLNDKVSVSLLRSSSKATSLGGLMSSIKLTAGFALLPGTGMIGLPAISFTKSALNDIQQLLISEQRARSFCIS